MNKGRNFENKAYLHDIATETEDTQHKKGSFLLNYYQNISEDEKSSQINSTVLQLDDLYNQLEEKEKELAIQAEKIKKSLNQYSKKFEEPIYFSDTSDIKKKKEIKDLKFQKRTTKPASERLKFTETKEKPGILIDKLEALTNREIDLYFKPMRPISDPIYSNGVKKTEYKNKVFVLEYRDGTIKIKRNDSENIRFNNGDIEQRFNDGLVIHQYFSNKSIDACLPNGIKYIVFRGGQVECHDPSGIKTVYFGDDKYMRIDQNGKVTIKYEENLPDDWPRLSI